ncbi:hypothetical protein ACEQPO_30050 [Bacillus sp. SL00103]
MHAHHMMEKRGRYDWLHCVPMSQTDYDVLMEKAIQRYAEEKVRAGTWEEGESLADAEEQFDRLLPEGLQTEHHELWNLLNGEEAIGWVLALL